MTNEEQYLNANKEIRYQPPFGNGRVTIVTTESCRQKMIYESFTKLNALGSEKFLTMVFLLLLSPKRFNTLVREGCSYERIDF